MGKRLKWNKLFNTPISENLKDGSSIFEDDKEEKTQTRTVTKYVAGVSPWTLIVAIGVFFLVGYMAAWVIMRPDSEGALVYGCIAVAFAWFLRKPMGWWGDYVVGKNIELQQQKDLEEKLGLTGDMPTQPKREKQQQKKYAFTSDDFDDKAQSMLMPMIKQARKAKAKISGEGLINEILKSFR